MKAIITFFDENEKLRQKSFKTKLTYNAGGMLHLLAEMQTYCYSHAIHRFHEISFKF